MKKIDKGNRKVDGGRGLLFVVGCWVILFFLWFS
jgi:hypothetical protein